MTTPETIPSFRRDRVADGVTTYLRDLILTGQLRAGEHLRVEHLAARMNVSITPVRESLLELLTEGYVEREAHRGYVVAVMSRTGFQDQVLVLAMIMGELAGRAAAVIEPAQVTELTRLQRAIQQADKQGDLTESDKVNYQFHRLINKIADSPKLAWLAQRHSHYVPRQTFQALEGHPAECTHDHKKVLAALRERDPDAARSAMVDHLVQSGKVLVDVLDAEGFWAE